MGNTLDNSVLDAPTAPLRAFAQVPAPAPVREAAACFHCGLPCRDHTYSHGEKVFCCHGCLTVHDLLVESGLTQFYQLNAHPGTRIQAPTEGSKWAYLDDPALQEQLLDFKDSKTSRVTLSVPAIHCVACVWLLENLFRLAPGIGLTRVNFPRREVSISYSHAETSLSQIVGLLASIGYEPRLTLGTLDRKAANPGRKRQWLQIGVAGFAFGNIMLFSLPLYLGLDTFSGPLFRALFGGISLVLALPVISYCASDYWRSALLSVRQRFVTLDVPIVLGLIALYAQSAYEIVSSSGEGYLDSLAGLVFFLLCGRMFQQKTHDRLAFDRDYRCFFPLSVTRKRDETVETVPIAKLGVGDRLLLRNHELLPADSRLVSGEALIDYSFVTGESEPVSCKVGDHLYAGGKQVGATIEVQTLKPVSQSYLTSLWSHEAFQKPSQSELDTLVNRYSRRFTLLVILVAVAACAFWLLRSDPTRGLKAFTSVLIVACPCALALATPFTLGTAQRLLARLNIFLKRSAVLERLAQIDTAVFDKTGTLTSPSSVAFRPASGSTASLSLEESLLVASLTSHSTHPLSSRLSAALRASGLGQGILPVKEFRELPGCGLCGVVDDRSLHLGSLGWLRDSGFSVPIMQLPETAAVGLVIDRQIRGVFLLESGLRPEVNELLNQLSHTHTTFLLSGDNSRERERFQALFGTDTRMHFNQSPLDKSSFIRDLRRQGRKVLMVGDGLNDAGALKQSDVGVAVVENIGAFSPASDMIVEASQVCRLHQIIGLARKTTHLVRISFAISAVYNVIGISIAAAGILSPLICAVLMPLSSVSVVLFAVVSTRRAALKLGLTAQPIQT